MATRGHPRGARRGPRYGRRMICTFVDKQTEQFYVIGKSHRVPPDVARRALRLSLE